MEVTFLSVQKETRAAGLGGPVPACLVILMILLASCGSGEELATDGVRELNGYPIFDETQAYRSVRSENLRYEELLGECIRLEGFEYHVEEPPVIVYAEAHEMLSTGEFADEDYAKRFGFGLVTVQPFYFEIDADNDEAAVEILEANASVSKQEDYLGTLSGPEEKAYLKVFDRCRQETDEDFGPRITDGRLDQIERIRDVKLQFTLDLEVVEYYEAWSECMRERGYDYRSPLEAYLQLEPMSIAVIISGEQQRLDDFADLEIETAVAVVACGESPVDFLPEELESVWSKYSTSL